MKISIITPTIRPEGLKLVEKALNRQTFKDFEWLVGSSFKPEQGKWVKDDFKGGFWTLNRIYNKLVGKAKGRLLISWQDYTFADPDCLSKFWFHFKKEPKTLITAVGNKYKDESWKVKTWQDPRERDDMGSYYSCVYDDIEANLCSVPKEAFYAVGGFDEALDFKGYGMDFYSVCNRLDDLGSWDFKIDQTNKSYSLEHERPKDWNKKNLLTGGYQKRRKELIEEKKWPVLTYLEKDDINKQMVTSEKDQPDK